MLLDAPSQEQVDRDPLAAEVAALVVVTGPRAAGSDPRIVAVPSAVDSEVGGLPASLRARIRGHAASFAAFARLRASAPPLLGDSPEDGAAPYVAAQHGGAWNATLCASQQVLVVLVTPRGNKCSSTAILLPRASTAGESTVLGAMGAICVDVANEGTAHVAAAFPGHGPVFTDPADTDRVMEAVEAWPGPAACPAPLLARVGDAAAHRVLGATFGAGDPTVGAEFPGMRAALQRAATAAARGEPSALLTAESIPTLCDRPDEEPVAASSLRNAGDREHDAGDAWAAAARSFAVEGHTQRWSEAGPLQCRSPDARPATTRLWACCGRLGDAALAVLDTGHVLVGWRPAGGGAQAAWLWAAVHCAGLRCRVARASDGLADAACDALRLPIGLTAPCVRSQPIEGGDLCIAVLFLPHRGPWVQAVNGAGDALSAGVAPFSSRPAEGGAADLTCCDHWPIPFPVHLTQARVGMWLQRTPPEAPLLGLISAANEAWARPYLRPWRLALLVPLHAALVAWAAAEARPDAMPTQPCRLRGGWALLRAPRGAGLAHKAWVLVSAVTPHCTIVVSAGFHGRLLYAVTEAEPPTAFGVLWRRGVLPGGQPLAWDMGAALRRQWLDAVEALASGGEALETGPAGATQLSKGLVLCQGEDAAFVVVTRGEATPSVLHLARGCGHGLFASEDSAVTRVPPAPGLVANTGLWGEPRQAQDAREGLELAAATAQPSTRPRQAAAAVSIPAPDAVVRVFDQVRQGALPRILGCWAAPCMRAA